MRCFVARDEEEGLFAHGETPHKAAEALLAKKMENMDTEETIERFANEFPDYDKPYPIKKYYEWHHYLTGSCEMGRQEFARNHGIDIENGEATVREFIALTENDFGGEVIKMLKERYE